MMQIVARVTVPTKIRDSDDVWRRRMLQIQMSPMIAPCQQTGTHEINATSEKFRVFQIKVLLLGSKAGDNPTMKPKT